jgi:hypothetical protein
MLELKYTLYRLARQAEYQSKISLSEIQREAEQSLRLIDSYLLSSAAEYGQLKLDLEPMAIGSVMHEASMELRNIVELSYDEMCVQTRASQPVMTNRSALHGFLMSVGQIVSEISNANQIVMRSFATKNGDIGVGVFAEDIDLSVNDLRTSLDITDVALMPFAKHSSKSGVLLKIADGLAVSLGGSLEVKRMGKLYGLTTVLPKSDQLALV